MCALVSELMHFQVVAAHPFVDAASIVLGEASALSQSHLRGYRSRVLQCANPGASAPGAWLHVPHHLLQRVRLTDGEHRFQASVTPALLSLIQGDQ